LELIPLIGSLVSMRINTMMGDASMVPLIIILLTSLASLASSILLLVWFAKKGTHGSNQYGPDPKSGLPVVYRK